MNKTKIFEILHLGQQLIPNLDLAIHIFFQLKSSDFKVLIFILATVHLAEHFEHSTHWTQLESLGELKLKQEARKLPEHTIYEQGPFQVLIK